MRLSEVGRRYATGGGGDPSTPEDDADSLASGRYIPELDDTPRPPSFPRPLPPAADEQECERLRFALRRAILDLRNDEIRLSALRDAQARAHTERWAQAEAVAEAEAAVRNARLHSRGALVAAFINGEDTHAVRSEADAENDLAIRTGHLRHAEEIEKALGQEAAAVENGLSARRRDVERAAGMLLSRTALLAFPFSSCPH